MFDHKEALTILARSLDPSKPNVMQQAVQVLAAVCLIPPSGHERVLEAITMTGEIKGRERFQPVVQGLMVKSHPSLTVSYDIVSFQISAKNDLFCHQSIKSVDVTGSLSSGHPDYTLPIRTCCSY